MAFFMCSVHHTTCYQWPLAYKYSIAFEMAYSVGHVPLYTLTMYPPPKQKQKYFIALEMAFFMCSVHPTTCYQWPLAFKNSIAFEMAQSVGRVQGYTLTMYPPQTKTKILHSTWDGIFYVFCAPHHMLSVTPSLQKKLHSIWNGIFGGPCAGVHVNHVPPPPPNKNKNTS